MSKIDCITNNTNTTINVSRFKRPIILAATLAYILVYSGLVSPENRLRIYENRNGYPIFTGYIDKQHDGSYREYSKTGEFKTRIDSQGIYSKDGKFTRYDKILQDVK